jgi:hypothetical protein
MSVIQSVVEVDPARRAQWLMPSALRCVDPRQIRYLLPVDPEERWVQGDLLLVEVDGPVGLIRTIQNTNRRSAMNFRDATLFPGSKLVAVLAARAGSSTCIARVPERPVGRLDLHGVGGQAGLIDPGSKNSALYTGPSTVVNVLARLGDSDRRPLNMRPFGLKVRAQPRPRSPEDPRLVLVLGSDMDAGKTTTARRIIYSLRAMGCKVVAGKATGVGSLFDIASMFDAGATEVLDFAALGEPVTIGLSEAEVRSLFHRIFNHLRESAGRGGYVVLELADGIWYRETRAIMEDSAVRDLVTDIVFACHSILDAESGLALLGRLGYGPKVRAIAGKLGSSGLLRKVAPSLLGPTPVFDSMDYVSSPKEVAALFDRA